MPEKKQGFDLGDYVQVKDRIRIFYELFGQGRLVTTQAYTEMGPDGTPRVIVEAAAYRTPDDPLPGRGWSWMALPGTSNYTRGSELENTETSAWGRAIASLGILIDQSVASQNEIDNKANDGSSRPAPPRLAPRTDPATREPEPTKEPYSETEEIVGRVSRKGTVRKGTSDHYDLAARPGPDGHVIGFRLEVGPEKHIPQCAVEGPLGEMLWVATKGEPETLAGKWASVAGILYYVKASNGNTWYRLHVDRIETKDWILPADPADGPVPEPPEDVPLAVKA